MSASKRKPYFKRLLLVFLLSLAFVVIFNEGVFLLQKDKHDRAPSTIQLVIPAGTNARISAGEDVPTIPDEMVFVLGDTLEVKNEDDVSHQLGPIWVPPGSTGRLVLEQAQKLAYSCSFQPGQYFGLDVRQPTTLSTRITGVGLVTPATTALLFVYSLLIFPVKQPAPGKKELV